MDIKDLQPIVVMLVLLGVIIGIGLLIFDNFGVATKDSTDLVEEVTIAAGTVTLSYDDVTAISGLTNATDDFTALIATDNFTWTTAGVVTVNVTNIPNQDYNVTYTYDADSTTTTVMGSMATATSPIATTWLPLIVTIIVLSIILTLVITSFSQRRT